MSIPSRKRRRFQPSVDGLSQRIAPSVWLGDVPESWVIEDTSLPDLQDPQEDLGGEWYYNGLMEAPLEYLEGANPAGGPEDPIFPMPL